MGLFSKNPERKRLEERLDKSDRFCGSLAEYNSLKGQEHVIIDTGRPEKYVFIDQHREFDLLQSLFEQGCTGFIRYVPVWDEYAAMNGGYGTPVKRK